MADNPGYGPEVRAFVEEARAATGDPVEPFDAFAFGDSPQMANDLAALVVSRRKRATASLLAEYEAEGETLPAVGQCSVVLDGNDVPVCVIRTTEVAVKPFRDVDAAFARDEGEGDLSLAYWREAHRSFFGRTSAGFSEEAPVVCERFELVFTPQVG